MVSVWVIDFDCSEVRHCDHHLDHELEHGVVERFIEEKLIVAVDPDAFRLFAALPTFHEHAVLPLVEHDSDPDAKSCG